MFISLAAAFVVLLVFADSASFEHAVVVLLAYIVIVLASIRDRLRRGDVIVVRPGDRVER